MKLQLCGDLFSYLQILMNALSIKHVTIMLSVITLLEVTLANVYLDL